MLFCVLGSGSRGNSTLVESGKTTLLIDAGFSGIEIQRRLAAIGRHPDDLSAILVTHEHNDHISGVGVMSRRCTLPVYANPATHQAASKKVKKLNSCLEFTTGEAFTVGDLQIHPFSISHDTADPVGFVITDGRCTFGYCTDTGKITRLMEYHLHKCHGLVLEANHDPQMLKDGPYPFALKQRVGSSHGHLANMDAGGFLKNLQGNKLEQVVLAHLSETNNLPALALQTVREELGKGDEGNPKVSLACQGRPGDIVVLGSRQR